MACRLPLWPAAGFFLAYGLPFISSAGCQPELLPGQVLHVTYEAPTGKVEISSSRRFIYLNHISLSFIDRPATVTLSLLCLT
jgi:hypothetical protein